MSKKIFNVSVSDIEHIEVPGVSVLYATIRIGGTKRRQAVVKTSNQFKQHLKAKIEAYCRNRQKGC